MLILLTLFCPGKIAPPGSARLVKDDKETKKDDIINVDEIINKPTES